MKTGIITALVIVVIVGGIGVLTFKNRAPKPDTALVKEVTAAEQPVETLKIRPTTLVETLDRTGVLRANRDVVLSAEVQGTIKQVYKELGDTCKKGEIVFRLDQEGYRIARAQAQAALKLSEVSQEQARRTMARMEKLKKSAVATAQEFDAAETGYQSSIAAVEQARAGLRAANHNLKETNVRCPFTGQIAERMVDVGDAVGLAVPLVRLVNMDPLKLTVNVSAAELARLTVGMRVTLRDPAVPEVQVTGSVARLGVAADQQTRTFPIEIVVRDPDRKIHPGQIIRATCELKQHNGVFAVPKEIVQNRTAVFKVESQKAKQVTVTLGATVGEMTIVSKGLKAGDEVIVIGDENLSDGDAVKVIDTTEPPHQQAAESSRSMARDQSTTKADSLSAAGQ